MHDGFRPALAAACALLALGLLALALGLAARLPAAEWLPALFAPDRSSLPQLLVHYSMAPRATLALLVGAGLGLAGAALQQALRNPLASPSTLGVSAGAQLALGVATLAAPALVGAARELVALTGGAAAAALVFLLSWRARFAPLTVILSGMVITMFAGAAAAGLTLFNEHALMGIYVWGSGALNQQDWSLVGPLAWREALAAGMLALLARPLQLLELDEPAKSLGLSVTRLRLICLGVAVALSASIVSAVGVIGFIGLAAPALARGLGVRRLKHRLVWSAALGAGVLFATDAWLQTLESWTAINIPTGAATALIGAPVLLLLAPRLKRTPSPEAASAPARRGRHAGWALAALAVSLPLLALLALGLGRTPDGGFSFAAGPELATLLPWRWPRALAAIAAGAMLAVSGLLLQRLTRNPIASPEVLGVSSGAALGLVLALMFAPSPSYAVQIGAAALGAGLTAGALLAFGAKARAPEQLLIGGVALGAMVAAVLAMLMATGDPRMLLIANWMAGSTYDVEPETALAVTAMGAALLALSGLVLRWLALAPLGSATMRAVGVRPAGASFGILALASALAAGATIAVGPLSFAGLIAPHLSARLGLGRPAAQLAATALIGALVMLGADWLGRVIYPPFQVPAGLIGMLTAGPLLMWLLQRR